MCTIATAKVQRNYNCYNVYFNECLHKTYKSGNKGSLSFSTPHDRQDYMYDDIMRNPYSPKAHFVANKEYQDGSSISDVGPRGGWGYNDHTYKVVPDERFQDGFHYGDRVPKSDIYKGDAKFRNAIDKGESELNHYYNDDYEYNKGKGWQLKK